jgi:hypothetical protein
MNDGPVEPHPNNRQSKTFWMIGVMVVVLLVLIWPIKKWFFDKPPKTSVPEFVDIDPICQSMQKLKLSCVAVPMTEGVLGPGHIIEHPSGGQPDSKVTISKGNLFAGACAMPGPRAAAMLADELAELRSQEQANQASFDDVTFKLDRTFQAGADLPIPKLANLKLKAGPKLSEVQTISLKMPHAWMKIIDENQFINLLAGAAIDPQCLIRIINNQDRVVSAAAIAQDYDIIITENSGQSFGLSAAVKKGDISMNAGGDAGSAIDETIKKNSAIPMVLGVDFFNPEIFKQNQARLTAPVFHTTAQTNARVTASGPQGVIWDSQRTASLGQSLPITQSGGGGGNACGGGALSTASLNSVVSPKEAASDQPESRSFEFSTFGKMSGGLSRTLAFGCAAIPGNVEAQISFDTVVETIVRSEKQSVLRVDFTGGPAGRAEVRDWTGRSLAESTRESANGASSFDFALSGPGVYEVRVSGERHLRANGPSTQNIDEKGAFTVSLH